MHSYIDVLDTQYQSKPIWNLFQLFLASFCFFSVTILFKLPIDFYFGSGWTILTTIIFVFIFAGPVIFLQLKYGSLFKTGILGIMDKFLPLGLIFTIGIFLRNMIHVINSSALIGHCLTYIFFTLFNCDNKLCFGGVFPWSSCQDTWADGDCRDKDKLVLSSPTAEEKFFQNFIMQQTSQIVTTENFPSWFQYPALITIPHLLGWIFLFLMIIGGARIFGYILYAIVPIATLSFLVCFIYGLIYANVQNQWSEYLNIFFQRFPNHVPVIKSSWDNYAYEPLIWGLLSTFAHLTIGLNLWYGVYPIMGSWIGQGKKRTYLSWLLIVVPFVIFLFITSILNVAMLSSNYSTLYLRCHVTRDFTFPFTIAAHVFTELGTPEPVVVIYYVSVALLLLSSEALLIITSMETVINHLCLWHDKIANNCRRCYRIFSVLLMLILYFLSFTTILRSGIYWIQLMDFYLDRLIGLVMVGQAVCLVIIFAFSKEKGLIQNKIVKIIQLVFLAILLILSFAVLIWYAIDAKQPLPTQDCNYAKLDPLVEPIPRNFRILGWVIAASPFVIGLLIGPFIIYCHSKRSGSSKNFFDYMVHGDSGLKQYPQSSKEMGDDMTFMVDRSTINPYGAAVSRTSGTGKTNTNKNRESKMDLMRNTLQSSGAYSVAGPGGTYHQNPPIPLQILPSQRSTTDGIYMNDDPVTANFMYDQRQSLRRPLLKTPAVADTASASSPLTNISTDISTNSPDPIDDHEYTPINKKHRKKKRRQYDERPQYRDEVDV